MKGGYLAVAAVVLLIGINVPYTTSEPYTEIENYSISEPYEVKENVNVPFQETVNKQWAVTWYTITGGGLLDSSAATAAPTPLITQARRKVSIIVPNTYNLANNSLLLRAFYNCTQGTKSSSDGAIGVNALWEKGLSNLWYIEQQRYGADDIQAGIYANRPELVINGEKILNWGFAHQSSNGGFDGTGDAFHSTSLFIEATARALLLMKESGNPAYQMYINQTLPKLEQAARWIITPSVEVKGKKRDAPFTHRRYILAAALGETAALTNNLTLKQELENHARSFALDGLSLQTANGYNPEKGGYDSGYHVFGLYFSSYYFVVCSDPAIQERLLAMLDKGLMWESTRINADGSANLTGNTRVSNNPLTDEKTREGITKHFQYTHAIHAYVFGSTLLQDQRYFQEALLLAQYKKYVSQS